MVSQSSSSSSARSQLSRTQVDALLSSAQDARSKAYCPYSKFRVGASLLFDTGELVQGCNVENSSYGAGICAERTALVSAVVSHRLAPPGRSTGPEADTSSSSSAGRKPVHIVAIAVSSDLEGPCSPCGICRQFIRELCALDTPIFMVGAKWSPSHSAEQDTALAWKDEPNVTVRTLEQLLPLSFGPDQLDEHRHP